MHGISYNIYKLFNENVKRARKTYKTKKCFKKDKRSARASSLNNALKTIKNNFHPS